MPASKGRRVESFLFFFKAMLHYFMAAVGTGIIEDRQPRRRSLKCVFVPLPVYLLVRMVGFGRATRPCIARTCLFRLINKQNGIAASLLYSPSMFASLRD